jgi:hypothetical protein
MTDLDFWDNVLQACGAYLFFILVICAISAGSVALLFFVGLGIRKIWRWITGGTWNRVILSIGRRVFRGK